MKIDNEIINGIHLLRLTGSLDATTVSLLKEMIQLKNSEDGVRFVIDLAGVDFIDSSGLGGLVASLRTVNKREGDIKVAGLRPEVRSVFELTRLHRLFEVFDDSNAAVESF